MQIVKEADWKTSAKTLQNYKDMDLSAIEPQTIQIQLNDLPPTSSVPGQNVKISLHDVGQKILNMTKFFRSFIDQLADEIEDKYIYAETDLIDLFKNQLPDDKFISVINNIVKLQDLHGYSNEVARQGFDVREDITNHYILLHMALGFFSSAVDKLKIQPRQVLEIHVIKEEKAITQSSSGYHETYMYPVVLSFNVTREQWNPVDTQFITVPNVNPRIQLPGMQFQSSAYMRLDQLVRKGVDVSLYVGYGTERKHLQRVFSGFIREVQLNKDGTLTLICEGYGANLIRPIVTKTNKETGFFNSPRKLVYEQIERTESWNLGVFKTPVTEQIETIKDNVLAQVQQSTESDAANLYRKMSEDFMWLPLLKSQPFAENIYYPDSYWCGIRSPSKGKKWNDILQSLDAFFNIATLTPGYSAWDIIYDAQSLVTDYIQQVEPIDEIAQARVFFGKPLFPFVYQYVPTDVPNVPDAQVMSENDVKEKLQDIEEQFNDKIKDIADKMDRLFSQIVIEYTSRFSPAGALGLLSHYIYVLQNSDNLPDAKSNLKQQLEKEIDTPGVVDVNMAFEGLEPVADVYNTVLEGIENNPIDIKEQLTAALEEYDEMLQQINVAGTQQFERLQNYVQYTAQFQKAFSELQSSGSKFLLPHVYAAAYRLSYPEDVKKWINALSQLASYTKKFDTAGRLWLDSYDQFETPLRLAASDIRDSSVDNIIQKAFDSFVDSETATADEVYNQIYSELARGIEQTANELDSYLKNIEYFVENEDESVEEIASALKKSVYQQFKVLEAYENKYSVLQSVYQSVQGYTAKWLDTLEQIADDFDYFGLIAGPQNHIKKKLFSKDQTDVEEKYRSNLADSIDEIKNRMTEVLDAVYRADATGPGFKDDSVRQSAISLLTKIKFATYYQVSSLMKVFDFIKTQIENARQLESMVKATMKIDGTAVSEPIFADSFKEIAEKLSELPEYESVIGDLQDAVNNLSRPSNQLQAEVYDLIMQKIALLDDSTLKEQIRQTVRIQIAQKSDNASLTLTENGYSVTPAIDPVLFEQLVDTITDQIYETYIRQFDSEKQHSENNLFAFQLQQQQTAQELQTEFYREFENEPVNHLNYITMGDQLKDVIVRSQYGTDAGFTLNGEQIGHLIEQIGKSFYANKTVLRQTPYVFRAFDKSLIDENTKMFAIEDIIDSITSEQLVAEKLLKLSTLTQLPDIEHSAVYRSFYQTDYYSDLVQLQSPACSARQQAQYLQAILTSSFTFKEQNGKLVYEWQADTKAVETLFGLYDKYWYWNLVDPVSNLLSQGYSMVSSQKDFMTPEAVIVAGQWSMHFFQYAQQQIVWQLRVGYMLQASLMTLIQNQHITNRTAVPQEKIDELRKQACRAFNKFYSLQRDIYNYTIVLQLKEFLYLWQQLQDWLSGVQKEVFGGGIQQSRYQQLAEYGAQLTSSLPAKSEPAKYEDIFDELNKIKDAIQRTYDSMVAEKQEEFLENRQMLLSMALHSELYSDKFPKIYPRGTKPFQNFHYLHSGMIIRNEIGLNGKVTNHVILMSPTFFASIPYVGRTLQFFMDILTFWQVTEKTQFDGRDMVIVEAFADDDIPTDLLNTKTVTTLQQNVPQTRILQQTFHLKRGLEDMYSGSILITGKPDIKPFDYVYIEDHSRAMYGLQMVKYVNHVYSEELGYVTRVQIMPIIHTRDIHVSTLGYAMLKLADVAANQLIWLLTILGSIAGPAGTAAGVQAGTAVKTVGKKLLSYIVQRQAINQSGAPKVLTQMVYARASQNNVDDGKQQFLSMNRVYSPLVVHTLQLEGMPYVAGLFNQQLDSITPKQILQEKLYTIEQTFKYTSTWLKSIKEGLDQYIYALSIM